MMYSDLKKFIVSNDFDRVVNDIYCSDEKAIIDEQRIRYLNALDETVKLYGDGDYHIISSPGRVEISGNHTDHQRGNVVAASINIDNLCFVKKTDDNIVSFTDKTFGANEIDISDLSIHENEKGNTKSILRGVAARYKELHYNTGGFRAYQDIRVLVGSGLSSSACFEILITEIYNYLYNDDKIGAVDRAIISKWVENNFFGKPCGLMDQMAIAVGSFVSIDFHDESNPKIKSQEFTFGKYGYQLLVINSKASHEDLTHEYAAITDEMRLIADYFGVKVLSEVNEEKFYAELKKLRESIRNDRAILRAHHYFRENERAKSISAAIDANDIDRVLSIMNESGGSSYMYLQNVFASSDIKNQAVAIAIAMSKKYIAENGICRIQGGGFAGTIQAVVKADKVSEYIENMSKIFGDDSVIPVEIRNSGTKVII